MCGQIYRVLAGFYDVSCNGKIYRVRGAGRLRKNKTIPLVGDFVEFAENGFITSIYKRSNALHRPKVANVDQVAIVISLAMPRYSSFLLNKMLAFIEFHQIKPIIIFTKADLTSERYSESYLKDGYQVYEINNLDLKTLKPLNKIFLNKLTVFAGQSGVGKSTTIKNLTGIKRETQIVSKALSRGKHTTRVIEILEWNEGKLIDTPGFSSFQVHLNPLELARSYKDFNQNRANCQFTDCMHYKESTCMIKKLVFEHKKISLARYNDYLKILKEVKNG